jgi:signal transduction histidine kinase
MTSHELRNPLSAIVQCAESAITTLQHITTKQVPSPLTDNDARVFDEEISSCLDAIQTIVSCSAHAKRIIDDVLTLSKLDSNLILITPVRVQPTVVVHNAIKMFMIECQQNGITLEFQKDASIEEFGWIRLDPSRLLQILINLLYVCHCCPYSRFRLTVCSTNAIKFTKDRPVKKITVELGASWARPTAAWHSIVFSSDDEPEIDLLNQAGWGIGARAHLWVKVTDTGCGMAEHEQKDLFTRFKQASPRTHIKYGGSGYEPCKKNPSKKLTLHLVSDCSFQNPLPPYKAARSASTRKLV